MGSGGVSGGTNEEAGPRRMKLVGYQNFKRSNPRTDKFTVHKFHHVEFWCADATNTCKRCEQRRLWPAWAAATPLQLAPGQPRLTRAHRLRAGSSTVWA